ncbi:uncharacterized protein FTJAE_13508 [Fusarium tjaetaba]|uniref:Uncharacterized protein n=1 Tax=Fusarium tjaetaba TaxID=1567544 RepID=A0A8H5QJP3_9HYPO|nr:uncharacterized protein FTJAE_13508 [Fusarium tjaetaba]KAF5615006.1 hypothetical protein FTJAE_13508 [Fusarium tjaetaba]
MLRTDTTTAIPAWFITTAVKALPTVITIAIADYGSSTQNTVITNTSDTTTVDSLILSVTTMPTTTATRDDTRFDHPSAGTTDDKSAFSAMHFAR